LLREDRGRADLLPEGGGGTHSEGGERKS